MYIAAPLKIRFGMKRLDGYKKGLINANIEPDENPIYEGDFTPNKAYEIVKDAVKQKNSFNAGLAANDQMAICALKALQQKGFAILEQVAVVEFDNLFPSILVDPEITTTSVPRYNMGKKLLKFKKTRVQTRNKIICVVIQLLFYWTARILMCIWRNSREVKSVRNGL